MPINVGELLKERDRLQAVIEEAKIARSRIRQINVLVTMYGDQENVTVVVAKYVKCPKCGKSDLRGRAGLSVHDHKMHGKSTAKQRSAQAKKASAARRPRGARLRRVS
jgi:hypothetical protein